MNLELVNAPTAEPLATAEVMDHLRELDDTRSAEVGDLVQVARQVLEGWTGRAFLPQTWRLRLDAFPACDHIALPRPPLIAVDSVQYLDGNGTLQTLATTGYEIDTTAVVGRIHLSYGMVWPATRAIRNAVRITYQAGYADPAAVPAELTQALKLLVGHYYEHREPVLVGSAASKLPFTVETLVWPHRVAVW